MKKIIDFLRKIGLLRITKGDFLTGEYTDAFKKDEKKQEDKGFEKKSKKDVYKRDKIYFSILTVLSILTLLFFLMGNGFNFSFFIILLVYLFFIWYMRKFFLSGVFVFWKMILVFIGLFFFSLIFFAIFSSDNANSDNNSEKSSKKESLKEYDGKIYQISSKDGKISGLAGISDQGGSFPLAVFYNLNIENSLSQNLVCDRALFKSDQECPSSNFYNYVAGIKNNYEHSEGYYHDKIIGVFCENGFSDFANFQETNYGPYVDCAYGKRGSRKIEKFYTGIYGAFANIEDFLNSDELIIFDSASFTKRETTNDGNGSSSPDSIDAKKATKEGKEIYSYKLIFTEK